MRKRLQRIAAVSFAVLLFILVGNAIHSRSIAYVEAVTLLQVSGHVDMKWPEMATAVEDLQGTFQQSAGWGKMTEQMIADDVHPPLYYWLALLWRPLAGWSIEALRWLSAIFVVAQALLVVRFGSHLRNPVLAGLVFALSGLAVELGALARDYALVSLLILLAMVAAAGEMRIGNALLAGAACIAAVATHYLAWFAVGALMVLLAVRARREKRMAAWIPVGMMAAASVVLVPLTLHASHLRPEQFVGFRGIASEFKTMIAYVSRGVISPAPYGRGAWFGFLSLLLVSALLFLGAVRSLIHFRRDRRAAIVVSVFAAHLAGVFFLFLVNDKTLAPPNTLRYVGIVFPATVLLLLYGIEGLPRKLLGMAALSAVLICQAAQVRWNQELPGPSARKFARAVKPGSTVVVLRDKRAAAASCLILELPPGTRICAVRESGACQDSRSDVDIVAGGPGPPQPYEEAFRSSCANCRFHRSF